MEVAEQLIFVCVLNFLFFRHRASEFAIHFIRLHFSTLIDTSSSIEIHPFSCGGHANAQACEFGWSQRL